MTPVKALLALIVGICLIVALAGYHQERKDQEHPHFVPDRTTSTDQPA